MRHLFGVTMCGANSHGDAMYRNLIKWVGPDMSWPWHIVVTKTKKEVYYEYLLSMLFMFVFVRFYV